jgi:hypothetical protein
MSGQILSVHLLEMKGGKGRKGPQATSNQEVKYQEPKNYDEVLDKVLSKFEEVEKFIPEEIKKKFLKYKDEFEVEITIARKSVKILEQDAQIVKKDKKIEKLQKQVGVKKRPYIKGGRNNTQLIP